VKRRIGETESSRATTARPARAPGGPAGSVLALQRMAGNRAVAGLMCDAADSGQRATPTRSAPTALVTIKGHTQGVFKGSGAGGAIPALQVHLKLSMQLDKDTHKTTGQRSYEPIVFTKETDGSSPQFLQALANNEDLDTVKIEYMSRDPDERGHARGPVQTILLEGARIVSFEQSTGAADDGSHRHGEAGRDIDQISLIFTSINMTNNAARTSAKDEWKPGN